MPTSSSILTVGGSLTVLKGCAARDCKSPAGTSTVPVSHGFSPDKVIYLCDSCLRLNRVGEQAVKGLEAVTPALLLRPGTRYIKNENI